MSLFGEVVPVEMCCTYCATSEVNTSYADFTITNIDLGIYLPGYLPTKLLK